MNYNMWKEIKYNTPPKNTVILTKIDDSNGCRNVERLKFDGKLWWEPEGKMYVYYTPTHFAEI